MAIDPKTRVNDFKTLSNTWTGIQKFASTPEITGNISSTAITASVVNKKYVDDACTSSINAAIGEPSTRPSVTEISYLKDVTSSIQTQIDGIQEQSAVKQNKYTAVAKTVSSGKVYLDNMSVNNIGTLSTATTVVFPSPDTGYLRDFTLIFAQPANVATVSITFSTKDKESKTVRFVDLDKSEPFSTMLSGETYEFYFSELSAGGFRTIRRTLSQTTQS